MAVGKHLLPGGRRVLMDCIVQGGSGQYMRTSASMASNSYAQVAHAATTSRLREVLHVQSISHWAPVCVGPYSQVNSYRSILHFVAGQIGLLPATMKLHDTWPTQLEQAWTNVASILDALNGVSLNHLLSALVYIAKDVLEEDDVIPQIIDICHRQSAINAGIHPGAIDGGPLQCFGFDGYEDEETMKELRSGESDSAVICPILLISIAEMPVGALAEVEVVAVTKDAAASLKMNGSMASRTFRSCAYDPLTAQSGRWSTGHDFSPAGSTGDDVHLDTSLCSLGVGSVACALVTASIKNNGSVDLDIDHLSRAMLELLSDLLQDSSSSTDLSHCLHFRVYYVISSLTDSFEDGTFIRAAFYSAVSSCCGVLGNDPPAITAIPVHGMHVLGSEMRSPQSWSTVLAIQALIVDPVSAETDFWIRHGRDTIY